MTKPILNCPLCRDLQSPTSQAEGVFVFTCARCGAYEITEEASAALLSASHSRESLRPWAWAARLSADRGRRLRVTTDFVPPEVSRPLFPIEKIDRLIEHLGRKSERFGVDVCIRFDEDWPAACADGPNELISLLGACVDLGMARTEPLPPPNLAEPPLHGQVTQTNASLLLKGWERVRELRRARPAVNQAFVALAFRKDLDTAYQEAILPTLESAGYRVVRVDREEFNEKIDDFIVARLRESSLVVADFTYHRQNVYFEAGFAFGLNIPLIYCCREDEIEKAHFDTRQYNHIVWRDPADLKKRLDDRLRATVRLQ